MRVDWRELRAVCVLLGCVDSRIKGDHLMMTKPGMARPVVIKMVRDLADDIIRTNMQTLGVTRKDFEALLAKVRRSKGKRKKRAKPN